MTCRVLGVRRQGFYEWCSGVKSPRVEANELLLKYIELATAIFEWIECWYNPLRRHSSIGMLSPADYEAVQTPSDTDH